MVPTNQVPFSTSNNKCSGQSTVYLSLGLKILHHFIGLAISVFRVCESKNQLIEGRPLFVRFGLFLNVIR